MKSRKLSHRNTIKSGIFFMCVFVASFAALYLLGYVPNELIDQDIAINGTAVASTTSVTATTTVSKKLSEMPIRISIAKIGVNSIVQNPTTTNIYALDDLLLKGVVRYPGSGLPGEGNMFFFGHSTGLRLVNNQAFKAFNNLKNLTAGDTILVYSDKHVYTYKVNNVKLANEKDVLVDFSTKKNMLTLSTCNTFGKKQERYVVEADFVESSVL